ncbi:MAG: hypothetical protein ACK466_10220 [Pseudanabaena sp.]
MASLSLVSALIDHAIRSPQYSAPLSINACCVAIMAAVFIFLALGN